MKDKDTVWVLLGLLASSPQEINNPRSPAGASELVNVDSIGDDIGCGKGFGSNGCGDFQLNDRGDSLSGF